MVINTEQAIKQSKEERNQAFLNWIKLCNAFNKKDFLPFFIENTLLGYVHKDNKNLFKSFKHLMVFTDFNGQEGLTFHPDINSFELRTRAANEIAQSWLKSGVITSWVGEQYDVNTGFNHPSFFTIERAASSILGIKKYGIHLNAWVEKQGEMYLWVARRSRNKPTFLGKLDHLVAGGYGTGYTIEQTMIKECGEEAGVPETIAKTAVPVSMVTYNMDAGQKLQQDNLFIYDLKLDASFVPENTDGEAEEFYLWPVDKVLNIVSTTDEYKTNCNLVIIDFAIRHGFLKPDEPLYTDLCAGLQQRI